ncbi:MAG: hypothetical protein ACQESE_04225 [Nanobdellota archaeon]
MRDFDPKLYSELDAIPERYKEELFPKSIKDLTDIILDGSKHIDTQNPDHQHYLKTILRGKLFNIYSVAGFAYNKVFHHFYGNRSLGEVSQRHIVKNEAELIKFSTMNHIFTKELNYHQFSKERMTRKQFFKKYSDKNPHYIVERLNDVRTHFNTKSNFLDESLTQLEFEPINASIDVMNASSKAQAYLLFGIQRRKTPYSISRKIAYQRGKQFLAKESNGKKESFKPVVLDDCAGFMFCGSESVYVDHPSYNSVAASEMKNFFCKSPLFTSYYSSEDDNHYKSEKRGMKGFQFYIAPADLEEIQKEGCVLYYPELVGFSDDDMKKNLKVSVHAQGPYAFLRDRIGETSHNIYVNRKKRKINDLLHDLRKYSSEAYASFHETIEVLQPYFY